MSSILRTIKYRRVSHDEQKLHGFSLAAQNDVLDKYLSENENLMLVGDFCDAGVSGHAPLKQRKELTKALEMVKNGEADLIIFTKLDRFFRNVALYHEANSILEQNNCAWRAVSEDYETITAGGKFKVNIMLSVAQQERDTGSERIRATNEYKISNGQAINGTQPLGFMVQKDSEGIKRVVQNPETAPIVNFFYEEFRATHSVRAAAAATNREFGVDHSYPVYKRMIAYTIYAGQYRHNMNYTQGYITPEEREEFVKIVKNKSIKVSQTTKNEYLFTGLIRCPVCGSRLVGKVNYKPNKRHNGYRCNKCIRDKKCSWNGRITELRLEKYLLEEIKKRVNNAHMNVKEVKANDSDVKKIDAKITGIKNEMQRLNNVYMKGRIDEQLYDRQYLALEDELRELEKKKNPSTVDTEAIKILASSDFDTIYKSMDVSEKRMLFRSVIDRIVIAEDRSITNIIWK